MTSRRFLICFSDFILGQPVPASLNQALRKIYEGSRVPIKLRFETAEPMKSSPIIEPGDEDLGFDRKIKAHVDIRIPIKDRIAKVLEYVKQPRGTAVHQRKFSEN